MHKYLGIYNLVFNIKTYLAYLTIGIIPSIEIKTLQIIIVIMIDPPILFRTIQ